MKEGQFREWPVQHGVIPSEVRDLRTSREYFMSSGWWRAVERRGSVRRPGTRSRGWLDDRHWNPDGGKFTGSVLRSLASLGMTFGQRFLITEH